MATVAERAIELAKELVGRVQFYETQEMAFAPGIAAGWPEIIAAPHSKNGRLKRVQTESLTSKIEQALLAERRLARLEDAEIAHAKSEEWTDRVRTDEHTRGMADGADFVAMALRAAAEKEVVK